MAEARDVCSVVKLAFEARVSKIWLEGDSKNIINNINGISPPSWSIANIIDETRATLTKFEKVHVTHAFREANLVANWFTKKGVGADKEMIWHSKKDILMEAKSLIELEKIHESTGQSNYNHV